MDVPWVGCRTSWPQTLLVPFDRELVKRSLESRKPPHEQPRRAALPTDLSWTRAIRGVLGENSTSVTSTPQLWKTNFDHSCPLSKD
jgi:hypothetical protein